MIYALPAQKIDPKQIGTKHSILEGTIVRVRLMLPGEEVVTAGELALPVYVVNEDPEYNETWPLDPDEPLDMVLRYDLPATGPSAIPVYVVQGDDYAGGLQVQGDQAEENERQGHPETGAECGLSDWSSSTERLSGHDSHLDGKAKVRPADLGA